MPSSQLICVHSAVAEAMADKPWLKILREKNLASCDFVVSVSVFRGFRLRPALRDYAGQENFFALYEQNQTTVRISR